MKVGLITGSAGLIGSEAVQFFSDKLDLVAGIDNNLREYFFGKEASTVWNDTRLKNKIDNYRPHNMDIRDYHQLEGIFKKYNTDIDLIIHTAAQPSHDWAVREPLTDFSVNALGTLHLLELTRNYCPGAVFIFTSTNKVYGDNPNYLPLEELDTRWEIAESHPYYQHGIDENLSIDRTKHSLFGASKVSADILVQEYGKYFDMKTAVFRGGCLTGPNHSGAKLHGFLSYLMKCAISGDDYTIYGYKGKQVRDNIHSYDLINMFWQFYKNPRAGEVYNAGGGRFSNCSMQEAIRICEEITGKKMKITYTEENRIGDHIWWISNTNKFKDHFPDWTWKYNIHDILSQIFDATVIAQAAYNNPKNSSHQVAAI
jgi:CDP-paratose 2-epimerase